MWITQQSGMNWRWSHRVEHSWHLVPLHPNATTKYVGVAISKPRNCTLTTASLPCCCPIIRNKRKIIPTNLSSALRITRHSFLAWKSCPCPGHWFKAGAGNTQVGRGEVFKAVQDKCAVRGRLHMEQAPNRTTLAYYGKIKAQTAGKQPCHARSQLSIRRLQIAALKVDSPAR